MTKKCVCKKHEFEYEGLIEGFDQFFIIKIGDEVGNEHEIEMPMKDAMKMARDIIYFSKYQKPIRFSLS